MIERTNLAALASTLPNAWHSTVMARIGNANLKILRMDATAYPEESHDYPEALLVVEGEMRLGVGGEAVVAGTGEICIVPPGIAHSVLPGSAGTLLIVDLG